MNPSIPAARQYVTELCRELAELGFDEILLDDSGWPVRGHLEYIKIGEAYDPENLTEAVESFYQELCAALEETERRFTAGLTDQELKQLQTLLERIAANLENEVSNP